MGRKDSGRDREHVAGHAYRRQGAGGWVPLSALLIPLLFSSAPVQAACVPAGTSGPDVIVCDGTDTVGVSTLAGDDRLSLLSGADISRNDTTVGIFFDMSVTAVDLGADDDVLVNAGTLGINADAVALDVMNFPAKADLTSVGVTVGTGNDQVDNGSIIDVDGSAVAAVGGVWVGDASVPLLTSATAAADSTGIAGPAGSNTFHNLPGSSLSVDANADASMLDVSLKSGGLSLTMDVIWDGGTSATATAVGMQGGAGNETLINEGIQHVTAEADARSLAVTGTHEGLAVSITSTTSDTTAIGIKGGDGTDVIRSLGALTVTADAWTGAGSLSGFTAKKEAKGVVKSFMGSSAVADATGIAGGTAGNAIETAGLLTVSAEADAYGIEASWTPESVENPDWVGWVNTIASPWLSAGLDFVFGMETGVKAIATALGIVGSDLADTVVNRSTMAIDADSNAFQLKFEVDAGKLSKDIWEDVGRSLASVLSTTAAKILLSSEAGDDPNALATAIRAGNGDDIITNLGDIRLDSRAVATSTEVTLSNEAIDLDFLLVAFGGGTESLADAFGITGDAGNDIIANHREIDIGADATSTAIGLSGTFKGIAQTTVSAVATATATVIDGGDGSDTLSNWGDLIALSDTTAKSVGLVATAEKGGAFALDSIFDGGTRATSTASGMVGGEGDDTIRHYIGKIDVYADATAKSDRIAGAMEGIAAAVMTSTASSTAWGIDGGAGLDIIGSDALIEVDAESDAVSVGVALSGKGAALAMDAVWDGGTRATSEVTGIAGGSGRDTVTNSGTIEAGRGVDTDARARSTGVAGVVSMDATNVAGAVVTSTADAFFAGIDGGDGDDLLTNAGNAQVLVDVTADASSTGVAITGTGLAIALDAVWDGGTRGHAIADGINGGEGADASYNFGTVDVRSTAFANSNGIALAGVGVAGAVVTSTATAESFALRGGAGDDWLENRGAIIADAKSDAVSVSVALSGSGVAVAMDAVWDGGTGGNSTVVGMSGGKGSDTLQNFGSITLGKAFDTDAKARSWGVAGVPNIDGINVAAAIVTSTATSRFTGIQGGIGNDTLGNAAGSVILIDAMADAGSTSVAFTGTGVALAADAVWDGGTGADTIGRALDGGKDDDVMVNAGSLTVTAKAVTSSRGASGTVFGLAGVAVASTADAEATGLFGDHGFDTLGNSGSITVTADADATSQGLSLSGGGISFGHADTTATATVRGLAGGDHDDSITSEQSGHIVATGVARAKSLSVSITGSGLAAAFAGAVADVPATGIEGGTGADVLINRGQIDVVTDSMVDASSLSFSYSGASYSDVAESRAEVTAQGMAGGEGDDALLNSGSITIGRADNSRPMGEAYARSASWNLFGAALSDAVLSATTRAFGMAGDDGDDTLTNAGTIVVGPGVTGPAMVRGDVSGSSWTFAGGAYTSSAATVTSESAGLRGGAGDDVLTNTATGDITVYAYADMLTENGATTKSGNSHSSAVTDSMAKASGMDGGDGNNTLSNSGALTVSVRAVNIAENDSETGFFTGDGDTESTANIDLSAWGIRAGNGINSVTHTGPGTIDLTVTGWTKAEAYSDGADVAIVTGDAKSVTTAKVTGDAAGILVGDGNSTIDNAASVTILIEKESGHNEMAYARSEADGDGFDGDGDGTATASAIYTAAGIRAGDGDHTVFNSASVGVIARPSAKANVIVDADSFGAATGNADATADAEVVGIEVGDGESLIINSGTLNVEALPLSLVSRSVTANDVLGSTHGSRTATVRALAIGIRAGDGDQTIVNSGVISARAIADSDLGSASRTQSAIGIRTGTGNDSIDNRGTIETDAGGVPGSGTGISSGAGDDRVRLFSGSRTAGGIDLGEGDDVLAFLGTVDVSGPLQGGLGSDVVLLDGVGSMALGFGGFEQLRKQGEGVFTLSGAIAPLDSIVIAGGSLALTQPYNFSPTGTHETLIYGDGRYGRFEVGSARLDGALTVSKGPGRYLDGATFAAIEAGNALTGGFDTVTLPQATRLLSFSLDQTPSRVQVEAHALSYATGALGATGASMGRYLDAIAPAASGDVALVMGEVQNIPGDGQLNAALVSLSPETYDSVSNLSVVNAMAQTGQFFQRMGTVRDGGRDLVPGTLSFEPILLAYNGDGQSFTGLLNAARKPSRQQGAWVEAFGRWGDQDADSDGFSGFDFDMAGITLGYDRLIDDRWLAGAALSYTHTDVDFDASWARSEIDSTIVSVYGSWFRDDLYAQGVLSYGRNDYDQRRLVSVGGIDRPATSDHDGDVLAASLEAGLMHGEGAWQMGPYAGMYYARIKEDSFTENGAGGVSLRMDSRTTEALGSELGVRARHSRSWRKGELVTELSAAWLHDFDIDDRTVTGGFAGAPGADFALPGQDVERNGIGYGVGVRYFSDKGVALGVRYRGETRDGYQDHAVVGELRVEFD